MAATLLATRLSCYGAVQTLYVSGELDIATRPVLERAVFRALDGQGGEFHVDLSGLTFLDSSGAQALERVHSRVQSIGRQLVLVNARPNVNSVLELLGLDQLLAIRSASQQTSGAAS